MYHRVIPAGSSATARYCVKLEAFESQLCYLHDAGYYSVSLEKWRLAIQMKRPLPGRAVILTFDDGYFDFITHAWPLLKRYGFSATIFLVTDEVGGSNRWGHVFGEQVLLLGWNEIRQLQREGVEFGSHSASHPYLTALSAQDIVREGARSRASLECELGVPVQTFAYPYGAEDGVVRHLIGASGYVLGLSRRQGHSCYDDPLLALPRIEVTGFDRFEDFIEKLNPESLMAADR